MDEHRPDCLRPRWRALSILLILLSQAGLPIVVSAHDGFAQGDPVDYFQYSIGALLVVQTALIVVLLVKERRHQRAKADLEQLRVEMTHATRLALVGEVTASVAHEITQPLSAILSNVEAAELLLGQKSASLNLNAVREILADVKQDDLRATEIVRRLRALLHKRELHFESVDINGLTSDVLTLIQPDALRRDIAVRTALEPGLPQVRADSVHLQQVLMNLIVNAMQAMRDAPVHLRQLDIRTQRRGDECVEVSVIDTGHGMTTEQMSRAFDSFFTTKPDGMGLGLSIARSIVQAHGGAIWIDNRESGGTAFKFTVPVRAPCAPGARALASAARRADRHSQRGKAHDSAAGDDRRV